MIKVFMSYSRKDEKYKKELESHLTNLRRNKLFSSWDDRKIIPGEDWDKKIKDELKDSDLVLMLVSPDFIASDYCYDIEVKEAIDAHHNGQKTVIPIILRYCDWKDTPFSKIQCLPKDGNPVESRFWDNKDQAYLNIIEGLKKTISTINESKSNQNENKQETDISAKLEIEAISLIALNGSDFNLSIDGGQRYEINDGELIEIDTTLGRHNITLSYTYYYHMPGRGGPYVSGLRKGTKSWFIDIKSRKENYEIECQKGRKTGFGIVDLFYKEDDKYYFRKK